MGGGQTVGAVVDRTKGLRDYPPTPPNGTPRRDDGPLNAVHLAYRGGFPRGCEATYQSRPNREPLKHSAGTSMGRGGNQTWASSDQPNPLYDDIASTISAPTTRAKATKKPSQNTTTKTLYILAKKESLRSSRDL